MREKYEDDFEAGMGAEAIKAALRDRCRKRYHEELNEELEDATGQKRVRLFKAPLRSWKRSDSQATVLNG